MTQSLTRFSIEPFVIDLQREFANRVPKNGNTYYVDLSTEQIYIMKGGSPSRVRVPSSTFRSLEDFQKSYSELISDKEIIGFLVDGTHFIPETSFPGKYILAFKNNGDFLKRKKMDSKKINYFLLSKAVIF